MGGVLGGHFAGDLAGRRGKKVRRGRERDHPFAGVGAKDAALAAFASARPGRPASVQDIELEELRAENDRLSEALKEMAVELTLHRGKQRSGYSARSPRA